MATGLFKLLRSSFRLSSVMKTDRFQPLARLSWLGLSRHSSPCSCRYFATREPTSANDPAPETKAWPSEKVRSTFMDYFVHQHQHKFVPSSPVVPWKDPTLAFVNAGMNQFKNVFLGQVQPPHPRVANTQRCIRVGGKHNDLDVVGKDGYHHTLFEMMGNWSFQDYGKEGACSYALDLLTRVYGIPLSKLYFTYFGGDERANLLPDHETRDVWLRLGVPAERILEFGPKDNFWDMGAVGPCGPCTEIHYDHAWDRPASEAVGLVNTGDPTLIELWNIVFIEHQRTDTGVLKPLRKTFIDTGMGFERLVAVLNGRLSNYDTDVFDPVFDAIQKSTGCPKYGGSFLDNATLDESYRIMADHARMFTVAAADGLLPTSSHKLRNIIHRFCYHAEKSFDRAGVDLVNPVCNAVFDSLVNGFPDLPFSKYPAIATITDEAKRYQEMKDTARHLCFSLGGHDAVDELKVSEIHNHPGLVHLIDDVNRMVRMSKLADDGKTIRLEDAVRLCVSNDVSLEMFKRVAAYKKLTFDEPALRDRLKETLADEAAAENLQNITVVDTSRAELLQKLLEAKVTFTKDGSKYSTKYHSKNSMYVVPPVRSRILYMSSPEGSSEPKQSFKEGEKVLVVLDRTPFYCERGGQISDTGYIRSASGLVRVDQVYGLGNDDYVVHEGVVMIGEFKVGDFALSEVDPERRTKLMLNHTGVHLLNGALRALVKDPSKIAQKSSWVGPDYARFDFFCGDDAFKQGTSEEDDGILPVEDLVNSVITDARKVGRHITKWSDASKLPNLVTVPGEVYPEAGLTVIEVPELSLEPCCGTHVTNTSHLDKFVITHNRSVQAGIRSIKFVTGATARAVEKRDEEFSKSFADVLKPVSEGDDLEPVRAFEAMKEARKMLASAQEELSYRKKKELGSLLNSSAEQVRRAVKKQIVSMMDCMMKKAIDDARTNVNQQVACYLDFGPDCFNLDVPLLKATKMCPDVPVAVFAVSKNHIIGRCVVPKDAVTYKFTAASWMGPVAEFFDTEVKAPKGQDPSHVVGLKSSRLSGMGHEEVLILLNAAVRLANGIYPSLTKLPSPRSEENIS